MDYRLEQLRFELREDPSSRVFFKLGEHLRREGELSEAIEVLSGGVEQHPKYIAAWVSLGRALLDAGASREAADALNRAIALDPENAVATRFAGEAAIANGEWVEAIKALKRTRAMSGPDEVLDERIRFVEARLDEMGQLEAPNPQPAVEAAEPPPPGRSLDQVFADGEDEPGPASASDDVFIVDGVDEAGDDENPGPENNGRATMAVPLAELPLPSDETISFADVSIDDEEEASDTVFEIDADALIDAPMDEAGDLGVDPDPEPAEGEVFEIEAADDAVAENDLEDGGRAEVGGDTLPLSAPEIAVAREDALDEVTDESVGNDAASEDLPLPTMTLARLALDQGDLDLAEKTLRGVLEREPDHEEAQALLAGLGAGTGVDGVEGDTADETGDVRAKALRRWLEAVRLTSERLKP